MICRHRNHFETERTYVPENRQHSKNAKLGVPMGELNGSANRERSKADGKCLVYNFHI